MFCFSQVWMVPSEKIHDMLDRIKQERYLEMDPLYVRDSFSYSGCNSIFSNGLHNCLTWAIEKLQSIGIQIDEIPGSWIASLVKRATSYESTHRNLKVAPWI